MIASAPRNLLRTWLAVLCGLGMAAGLMSCAHTDEDEKLEKAQGPSAAQRSHGGGVPAPGKTGSAFPEGAASPGSAGRIG